MSVSFAAAALVAIGAVFLREAPEASVAVPPVETTPAASSRDFARAAIGALHAHEGLAADCCPQEAEGPISVADATIPREVPFAAIFPGLDPDLDWAGSFPERFVIALDPEKPNEFTHVSTTGGRFTGTRTSVDRFASVVLYGTPANDGIDFMHIDGDHREHSISVRGGRVVVAAIPERFGCGTVMGALPDVGELALAAEASGEVAAASTTNPVDVLFFYEATAGHAAAPMVADRDGATWVRSRMRNYIEAGNQVLINSRVDTFHLRFLKVLQVPDYARTGGLRHDLDMITESDNPVGAFVKAAMAEYGADVGTMAVGQPFDWAGLAWLGGELSVVVYDVPYGLYMHELGHSLTLLHDRKQEKQEGGTTGLQYGHRFTHTDGRDVGDLMSYANSRYVYFSNPDLTLGMDVLFPGSSNFAPGTVRLGVPAGEPGTSDCARVLRGTGARKANIRGTRLTVAPVIATHSAPVSLTESGSTTLSVNATGSFLSYQWRKNGRNVPGARDATLTIDRAVMSDAGDYECVVFNGLGEVLTAPITVSVARSGTRRIEAAQSEGRLLNLSARARVGAGDDVLIGGVSIAGGKARVLVRAAGPALLEHGIADHLPDPSLEAVTDAVSIASNQDWHAATNASEIAATAAKLGAFDFAADSTDAALLLDLEPGPHTFIVRGGGQGVSLLEVYLVSDSGLPGRLINLSARARVGVDSDVLIAGFVPAPGSQVLTRAIGPALVDLGVADALARPRLSIFAGPRHVDELQGWDQTYSVAEARALFTRLGAFDLAQGAADSIGVMNVDGARTAVVAGDERSTGVALAEVYLVSP
ncbi:hypothetical protein ASA1KI_40320 [Opitutales bacterium ASA1]|uniref:immunoglobulin domain-containing protein n=1 Tax=Congregicoccus parvus TaxID=3081749 RepID=UPI002B2ADCF8|nr:hypothetical protein ASA1KI_40320 [Opitutales bacterium ASA1]